MRIKLYQVNLKRDRNHVAFVGMERLEMYQGTRDIDSAIYDLVYEGENNDTSLEAVFQRFNIFPPSGYTGRSMSVSDVIEEVVENEHSRFWFCDTCGFVEVAFEVSKTFPSNRLRQEKKPEWGLYPDGDVVIPKLYWGARAIISEGYVELLPDRQSFRMADDVTEEEKQAFLNWINEDAWPILNHHVAQNHTEHIELINPKKGYRLRAEDRDSGGYLYIGVCKL